MERKCQNVFSDISS